MRFLLIVSILVGGTGTAAARAEVIGPPECLTWDQSRKEVRGNLGDSQCIQFGDNLVLMHCVRDPNGQYRFDFRNEFCPPPRVAPNATPRPLRDADYRQAEGRMRECLSLTRLSPVGHDEAALDSCIKEFMVAERVGKFWACINGGTRQAMVCFSRAYSK
jgi:hypothetical protein